jgi:hypothetical protein
LWVALLELAHLAGEWVLGGIEAKVFAYVFVLVALRELIDGRWNRVWIALGLASAFHVLVGGWSIVVCAGLWLLEPRPAGFVRSVVAMLPGAVVGAALSLIGLVPALALSWGQPPEIVAEANQIYVFERLPHHLALLALPTAELLPRLLRHGVLILSLWALGRAIRRGEGSGENRGLTIVMRFAWGALLLSAIGFTIEIALWNSPATAASLLRFYWFRLADVSVPLAVSLQTVTLLVRAFREQRAWAIWGLAAAIGLAGFHIAAHTAYRFLHPSPPADNAMKNYAAWVDVCDWISQNTPADAVFLTPRLSSTFKWRTDRAEVATRKDIPQDARSMVEWFHKLEDIYYYRVPEGVEPFNSVGELGTERAVEVARRYGAKYIVSDRDHPLALEPIYPTRDHPNDEYVVYAVED